MPDSNVPESDVPDSDVTHDDTHRYVTICQKDDVPRGEARMFVVDGTMIGIFNVAGDYFALHNECPHAGASLAHGYLEDDVVRCRIHHWRFSVRDGRYLDEESPRFNARTFPVRIRGDAVQVGLASA